MSRAKPLNKQGKRERDILTGCIALSFIVLLLLSLLGLGIWGIVRLFSGSEEDAGRSYSPSEQAILRHAERVDRCLDSLDTLQSEGIPTNTKVASASSLGDLKEHFSDLNALQLSTAQALGIPAPEMRAEIERSEEQLQSIKGLEHIALLEPMTHSVPYLVPRAVRLLEHIGQSYQKALHDKGLRPLKLVVTSVLRTQEDVNKLRQSNGNASANSCHRYGTTFDISWKRFRHPETGIDHYEEAYKQTLAEVLHSYRALGTCYIVYERRQACFHITAR